MSETLWVVHHTARLDLQEMAKDTSKKMGPSSAVKELVFSQNLITPQTKRLVVVSGDGGLTHVASQVAEHISQGGQPIVIYSLPAGSENASWLNLDDEGQTATVEQLLDNDPMIMRPLYPGKIVGDDDPKRIKRFIYSAEFGRGAVTFNEENERLREKGVSRSRRMERAAIRTAMKHIGAYKQSPIIEAVVNGSYFKGQHVLPNQHFLDSDQFTRLRIPALSMLEVLQLVKQMRAALNNDIPFTEISKELFQTINCDRATISNHGLSTFSITGDIVRFNKEDNTPEKRKARRKTTYYIERDRSTPLSIAALLPSAA